MSASMSSYQGAVKHTHTSTSFDTLYICLLLQKCMKSEQANIPLFSFTVSIM